MATNHTVDVPIEPITKNSSEDSMVATLIMLKALQLRGIIEPQRFRVEAMHIIWCSREAGIGDAVARRVDEVGDGRARGATLRGAEWVPVSELTYRGEPVKLKTVSPEQARIDAGIVAEERFWADLRVARRQDALERPAR